MKVVAAVVAVTLALLAAVTATAAPPAGLTKHGQLVWELDALLSDRFGEKLVCMPYTAPNLSPASCKKLGALRGVYVPTFEDASGSSFKLVSRRSAPLVHPVALRVGGQYVSCGPGMWLALGHGAAFWALDCV